MRLNVLYFLGVLEGRGHIILLPAGRPAAKSASLSLALLTARVGALDTEKNHAKLGFIYTRVRFLFIIVHCPGTALAAS